MWEARTIKAEPSTEILSKIYANELPVLDSSCGGAVISWAADLRATAD